MKKHLVPFLVPFMLLAAGVQVAMASGEEKSKESIVVTRCATCHGMAGVAFHEGWPDLPELSREQLEAILFAHRDAEFADDMVSEAMANVTFDLTDEEIKEAAEYYSSLKVEQNP